MCQRKEKKLKRKKSRIENDILRDLPSVEVQTLLQRLKTSKVPPEFPPGLNVPEEEFVFKFDTQQDESESVESKYLPKSLKSNEPKDSTVQGPNKETLKGQETAEALKLGKAPVLSKLAAGDKKVAPRAKITKEARLKKDLLLSIYKKMLPTTKKKLLDGDSTTDSTPDNVPGSSI